MKKFAISVIFLILMPAFSIAYYCPNGCSDKNYADRSNQKTGYDNDLSDGDFNYFYPKEEYDLRYPHTLPEYIPMPFKNSDAKYYPKRAEFPEEPTGDAVPENEPPARYGNIGDKSYLRYYKLGRYAVKNEDEPQYRPQVYRKPDSYYDDRIYAYVVLPAANAMESHSFQVIYS